MQQPGANGGASAADCKLTLTSKSSKTQFSSSRFLPSTSILYLCPGKVNPSRSDQTSNTSTLLVKSSYPWGDIVDNLEDEFYDDNYSLTI